VFVVGWSLILEKEDTRRPIIKAVVMKKHVDMRTNPLQEGGDDDKRPSLGQMQTRRVVLNY